MSSRPSLTQARQRSLYLSETAFHDAAAAATAHTGDNLNDDPNALQDTQKMVDVATAFLERTCPQFLEALDFGDTKSKTDRLVKVGRNVSSTLRFARRSSSKMNLMQVLEDDKQEKQPATFQYSKTKIDASLSLLADECADLAALLSGTDTRQVPKVRFGRTELQMPIVTLGCMRFQQSWNRGGAQDVLNMDQVEADCQENLMNILRFAIQRGVTHIETAKGYGSSELQLGSALQEIFDSGLCQREDLIIQTKGGVSSSMTPEEYKQLVRDQVARLKIDHVDLFSVHGLNMDCDLQYLFDHGDKGNLITALQELKQEGVIRHIGFSSHGRVDVIRRAIETNAFDYCNLHYHFCGSYTCTGEDEFAGNLSNIRLAYKHDMGVFIISPYDKGGRLYAPSNQLRDICLPDLEPMTYGSVYLWQHEQFDGAQAPIHTIVCGAARPSDLDQPVLASLQSKDPATTEKRERVAKRLELALHESLGKEWTETWHHGLPNWHGASQGTQLGNIVWLHNVIKAFGLLDFARERYQTMETNIATWDSSLTKEENMAKITPLFGWCPGCAFDETLDYSKDFEKCPAENRAKLAEAIRFVHQWCAEVNYKTKVATEEGTADEKKTDPASPANSVPLEWETCYDMRPWTAFPERS